MKANSAIWEIARARDGDFAGFERRCSRESPPPCSLPASSPARAQEQMLLPAVTDE